MSKKQRKILTYFSEAYFILNFMFFLVLQVYPSRQYVIKRKKFNYFVLDQWLMCDKQSTFGLRAEDDRRKIILSRHFGRKQIFFYTLERLNKILIVYYVPRRTMRVIARRATMLAGDRSQGVVEMQVTRSWGKAETKPRRNQSCELGRESRDFPNRVHWHVFFFM